MEKRKRQKIQYMRVYTLRDQSTKSIKVETWRTYKDEMRFLGIKESDLFQIQLIEVTLSKKENCTFRHNPDTF
ncbi:hypothetical protein M3215_11810 [Bacillus cytotoxicus]|uniref:Uncharacterized protein n=1 Tax=Bacillus cytotoxicus TaxID=580165 RepID=A0ACC6A7Q0_9BACI|nr:hypothetical protein [Bacillus cytotoxicus]